MPKIQIRVEKGIIQSIDGPTPEIAVELLDYDLEKYPTASLSTDENGQPCEIKEWHGPE